MTAGEQRSRDPWLWCFAAALALLGPLICFYYVSCERSFYWWDYANYHVQARDTSRAFATSLRVGYHYVGQTLQTDYNALYSLPLVPFLRVFGEQRAVYVAVVCLLYFLPLVYTCGAICRRLYPEKPSLAFACGAGIAFLAPAYWRPILRGYPDLVGAMLLALGVLLHLRRQSREWRWWESVGLGLALGTSVLLRRHFAYAVVAFYAAVGVDMVWQLARSGGSFGARGRVFGKQVLHSIVTAVSSVLPVVLTIPNFASGARAIVAQRLYASWEVSRWETSEILLNTVGGLPLFLGIAGGVLHFRSHPESRPALRFLTLLAALWLCVWIGMVRQPADHYPHVVPLVLCIGTCLLVLRFARESRPGHRMWRLGTVSAALFVAFVQPAGGVGLSPPKGSEWVLPANFRPLVDPAHSQVEELVGYLRSLDQHKLRVVVAASSESLNFDLLRHAEAKIYPGRGRLELVATPQADSLGQLPTADLLNADAVVVATPFQYHLYAHKQKVVRVLMDAFVERWEISRDFELMPEAFELPRGAPNGASGQIRVWKRVRPTGEEVAYRFAVKVAEYVGGAQPGRRWYVTATEFKSSTSVADDGTATIVGHPARSNMTRQTVFESGPAAPGAVQVSGEVEFLDPRCPGAELFVVASASTDDAKSLGAFEPARGPRSFSATLPSTGLHPLRLMIKSAPKHPQEIDFCTLKVASLKVGAP
jgi:hypothetical protein